MPSSSRSRSRAASARAPAGRPRRSWSRMARRTCSLRRPPISRPTARANMCSTMAGPTPGSGRAEPIIPSFRSRCRSRRCRGRACSAASPQHLLAALEAVTVQNDLSSAHITFIDEDGVRPSASGAAGCIRDGIQYHWLNRGYRAASTTSLRALASRKRKAIRKERAAAREGLEFVALRGCRDRRRPTGTAMWRFYQDTGSPQMGPALSDARVLRPGRREHGRQAAAVPRPARRSSRSPARSTSSARTRSTAATGARSRRCRSSISSSAIIRRSNGRSRTASPAVQAGAQGEHKLARGYEPVITRSAHFIARSRIPRRGRAISSMSEREAVGSGAGMARGGSCPTAPSSSA